jgi:hypothetical protein
VNTDPTPSDARYGVTATASVKVRQRLNCNRYVEVGVTIGMSVVASRRTH